MALTISTFFIFSILFTTTYAATFDVHNNCPYNIWAAWSAPNAPGNPGGGAQLGQGGTWTIQVPAGTTGARIWPRTGCSFDGSGRGHCITGDCGGVLQCRGYGQHPNTLAEFGLNQWQNLDFFDISLIEGFNVPMDFSPTSGGCSRGIRCSTDVLGQCPAQIRLPGGCYNPCTGDCGENDFSRYFKRMCPDAYSFPRDDKTISCPGGTNYRVTFCP